MRVCIIKNADAEKNSDFYRIVNSLQEVGYECIILSRNRKSNSTNIIKKKIIVNNNIIDVYEISIKSKMGAGLKNILNLTKYMSVVKKWLILNSELYDVVHVFDLDSGLPTLQACRKLSKPYVYHIADFYVDSHVGIPKLVKNFIKKLEFSVINNAEATIICTEQRKEQIEGSNPKELVVIHNTPGIKSVAKIDNNEENLLKIAYVGILSDYRFIKEIINIVKDDKNMDLTIAGTGQLKDYVEKSDEKYSNINYLGQILYEDAIEVYKKCDVIVAIYNPEIKNHKYSAPNKFYEAIMLGKAIIVAEGTGVDELVKYNSNGLVVKYDINSVRDSLTSLKNNKTLLHQLKINSLKAIDKYSTDEMSKRLIKIYKNIEI